MSGVSIGYCTHLPIVGLTFDIRILVLCLLLLGTSDLIFDEVSRNECILLEGSIIIVGLFCANSSNLFSDSEVLITGLPFEDYNISI